MFNTIFMKCPLKKFKPTENKLSRHSIFLFIKYFIPMKKILLLSFVVSTFFIKAQDYQVDLDYYLPADVSYHPDIPTPKSSIGHEVGEWHITHDKLIQYMQVLDKASDRITIENRGSTFEGRPLPLLTITSPNNHKNIESIRNNHLAPYRKKRCSPCHSKYAYSSIPRVFHTRK